MPEEQWEIMTIDEVCEALMVGRNTVYKLLNSKVLRAFRIGRTWKIPKSAVTELIQNASSRNQ